VREEGEEEEEEEEGGEEKGERGRVSKGYEWEWKIDENDKRGEETGTVEHDRNEFCSWSRKWHLDDWFRQW
jgi:hypothetical protein